VLNVELAAKAAQLGSDYSDRLKAIAKWCDVFSIPIGKAAANALDIMHRPERVGVYSTYSFLESIYNISVFRRLRLRDLRLFPRVRQSAIYAQNRLSIVHPTG
jgi:hypothetical protein